ncbi:MAG: hypothetical protein KAF24_03395 [Nitrosopumilaceae archaeon]|nr:hypothetical protein [Nitrosopumilaceae archaeon]
MVCGCHCIICKNSMLESKQVGKTEDDGYFDMHHTCKKCKTHFNHLDGQIITNCKICDNEK